VLNLAAAAALPPFSFRTPPHSDQTPLRVYRLGVGNRHPPRGVHAPYAGNRGHAWAWRVPASAARTSTRGAPPLRRQRSSLRGPWSQTTASVTGRPAMRAARAYPAIESSTRTTASAPAAARPGTRGTAGAHVVCLETQTEQWAKDRVGPTAQASMVTGGRDGRDAPSVMVRRARVAHKVGRAAYSAGFLSRVRCKRNACKFCSARGQDTKQVEVHGSAVANVVASATTPHPTHIPTTPFRQAKPSR